VNFPTMKFGFFTCPTNPAPMFVNNFSF
jgi:hypothetical protein